MTVSQTSHATCLGCGCACDDIDVLVESGRIIDAQHACALGVAWFGDGAAPARTRAGGRDISIDQALDAAAALLAGASRPLVYLAPDLACEAQRHAVALADMLGAAVDSVTSDAAIVPVLAAQERGRASATLGEIRNRADVIVFWGVDPAERYPRYWTRYAPEPSGLWVRDGRRSRTVVAVDVGDSPGPADADARVRVPLNAEVAVLTALAHLVRRPIAGPAVRPRADANPARLKADTPYGAAGGVLSEAPRVDPWVVAAQMAPVLTTGKYVVVVADGESAPGRDAGGAAGLVGLTQALNTQTRAALSTLRAGGNRSGADAVLTWQTGYPAAVDFARGYPRYAPYDGTAAALLERAEVDAVALIGSSTFLPSRFVSIMSRIPSAVIGPRASEGPLAGAEVVIDTGVAGIHEEGTAFRMDDVPLPLRRVVDGPPAAAVVMKALVDQIDERRLAGREAKRSVVR